MSKQLYVVELLQELVVVAESKQEAEALARDADYDTPSVSATELCFLPADWDLDCIPWGEQDDSNPDRTVGEWIELGAAPRYRYPSNK